MRCSTPIRPRRLFTMATVLVLAVAAGNTRLHAAPQQSAAAEPIAVFALASPEHLLADVQFLAELGGFPMLATAVGEQLRGLTEVDQIEGIDMRRPLGALVGSDGLLVYSMAFVPVTDTARLLESLRKPLGQVTAVRAGLWKIGQGPATAYVREHNGWAFLAQREETLQTPPDPAAVLGELPKRYDVALRLNLDRVPEQFTTLAVDAVRLLMRRNLERYADESPERQTVRRTLATWEFLAYEHLLTDSQQVTLGWALKRDTRRMILDIELVPVPGSWLQTVIRGLHDAPQRVPLDDGQACGLHAHCRMTVAEPVAVALRRELGALRSPLATLLRPADESPAQQAASGSHDSGGNGALRPGIAAALMGCLLDACEASVTTGQFEVALSVSGQQAPWTVIGRAHIGRGTADRVLAQLRQLAQQFPQEIDWDADASAVEGHEVHVLTLSAEVAETLSSWLGPRWKVYALSRDEHIWVAAGPQAVALLRRALRGDLDAPRGTESGAADSAPAGTQAVAPRNATTDPASDRDGRPEAHAPDDGWPQAPLVIRVRASVLARWLAAGETPLGNLLTGLGASLATSDDTVQLSATVVDDALRVRCEAREGVLRAAVLLASLRWLLGG